MKIGRSHALRRLCRVAYLPVAGGFVHRRQISLSALALPSRLDPCRRLRSADAHARPLPKPATQRRRLPKHAPSAKDATFPRDVNGAIRPGPFVMRPQSVYFRANLKVQNNQLMAVRIEGQEDQAAGQWVSAVPSAQCDQMRLESPVDFYIAEQAASPLPLHSGQELWIELTVPPKGPPRPIQLALKTEWRLEAAGGSVGVRDALRDVCAALHCTAHQASSASSRLTRPFGSAISTRLASRSILRR